VNIGVRYCFAASIHGRDITPSGCWRGFGSKFCVLPESKEVYERLKNENKKR
jgi:hypothetical protein